MLVNPPDSAARSLKLRFSELLASFGGLPTSMVSPREVAAEVRVIEPVPVTEPLEPRKSISLASIVMSPVPVSTWPRKITCVAPRMINLPLVVFTDPRKSTTPDAPASITRSPLIVTSCTKVTDPALVIVNPASSGNPAAVPCPTSEFTTTLPARATTFSLSATTGPDVSVKPDKVCAEPAPPSCTPVPPAVILRVPLTSSESIRFVPLTVSVESANKVVCPEP